jgi:subtilisin family serine protease
VRDQYIVVLRNDTNERDLGLDRIDQHDLPFSTTYNYSNAQTGAGVNVYVLDSGIKTLHTEFKKPTGGWRVVNDFDSFNDGQIGNDCNGHGTFIAGVIGVTRWESQRAQRCITSASTALPQKS